MITPNDITKVCRQTFPSNISGTINTEFPVTYNNTTTFTKVQKVIVDDPRTHLYNFFSTRIDNKVKILRVLETVKTDDNPNTIYKLRNIEIVEVIKEYTFEEWDSILK